MMPTSLVRLLMIVAALLSVGGCAVSYSPSSGQYSAHFAGLPPAAEPVPLKTDATPAR